MIPSQEAESIILDLVNPLEDKEIISLPEATGRILAQSVASDLDFPHWDNSAMDGYAVKFADVRVCSPEKPAILEIIAEIPAGIPPKKTLQCGQAARIFTGALLPKGADTIVVQENTRREGNLVKIFSPPAQPLAFVRRQGEFYQAGTPLLWPGTILNAPEIAVLAAAQCSKLTVYRRPQVAIFSTGDELVYPEQPLKPGQIVDSNQYALAAHVVSQGAIPITLGIVPDRPEILRDTILKAINSADMVLSTGGVSVGDYDYVEELLEQLGGHIHIRSVRIKPGKPLKVAKFDNGCLYFGIPGNPVSALVSCWRFVQPALKKLAGLSSNWHPLWIKAKSRHQLRSGGQRETYLWGNLDLVEGVYEFQLAGGSHSSANLINLVQTNALAVLPVGTTSIPVGETVTVMAIA